MHFTRRTFLGAAIATSAGTAVSPPLFAQQDTAPVQNTRWMACRAVGTEFRASLFDEQGNILIDIPLPGRGHGIIVSPNKGHAIVFARRPGIFAYVINLSSGLVTQNLTTQTGRHFYGHGCFSHDGRFLYTSENEIETSRGIIAVRDVQNGYALVASHPSGGIGPHELGLLSGSDTLVVANGGIKTMPELGRTKLNLETMSPSLVLMNSHTGEIEATHKLAPDLYQLSIRHMSIGPSGVALALQYEGPKSQHMPLLASFDGSTLKLAETPPSLARAMRNYAGSVAHDLSGQLIGLTSPRGNIVSFWEANSLAFLGTQNVADVCGIAAGDGPGEFVIAGGTNALTASHNTLGSALHFANTQWDNHLLRIV
jgi:uncharacterized protein